MEAIQLSIFDNSQSNVAAAANSDLFAKFEAVKIDKSSLISAEDRKFCEELQQKFDEAVSLILKAQQFYQDHEMSNVFLSTKNLVKELDEKLTAKTSSFISKIVWHFRTNYSVTIDQDKFRKYDHTVTYQEIVEEILAQMDGMNFEEKAREEIRNAVRESIYNPTKIKVQSNKVSIADYLYFEEWFGKYGNRRSEKLDKLLKAIELFESGSFVVSEQLSKINEKTYRDDWFNEFTFPFFHKFQAMRFYKNGKVELKFKSHELAMQFAREFLNYT